MEKKKRKKERKEGEKNCIEIGRDSHLQYGICIWFNAWLKMHGKSHSLSRFGIFLVAYFFFVLVFYFAFFHGYLHTYIWEKMSMLPMLPFVFTCRLHKIHISTVMISLSYSLIPSVLPEWDHSLSLSLALKDLVERLVFSKEKIVTSFMSNVLLINENIDSKEKVYQF